MAKYVIFPHFKKEGKMERKQIGSFGCKRQPVAQATGASELENEKKGWLQWKITILITLYEEVQIFDNVILQNRNIFYFWYAIWNLR